MSEVVPVLAEPPPSQAPDTTSLRLPSGRVAALVYAWLILDFFTESRRSGQPSSSLTTTIFGQAFMALVVAALLFPDVPPAAFAAANLSLSTLLVGIGHLGDDRAGQRLRADRALVATSPLPRTHVLAARALHAAFYVGLLTIGMALPPAILGAFLPNQGWTSVPTYLGLACVCAGLFTAALVAVLRAADRLLGPARAQLAGGTLKALLLLGGLCAFATAARALKGPLAEFPLPRQVLAAWPPFWAGRVVAGDASAVLWLLGGFLLVALLVAPFTADAEPRSVARAGSIPVLDAALAHLTRARSNVHAVAAFTAAQLYRSASFRNKVLPLFGLPAGMWLLAFFGRDGATSQRLLAVAAQLPAVYLPFLVAFLDHGDEPRARWLFAASPDLPAAAIRRGVLAALTTHVLAPAHLALFAGAVPTLGIGTAAATSLFAFGLAIGVGAIALRRHREVPFSGAGGDSQLEFGQLVTFAMALTLVGLGFAALPLVAALPLGLATAGLAWSQLRVRPPAMSPQR